MCGIIGKIFDNEIHSLTWTEDSIFKLQHRGPDAFGTWQSENKLVEFGHSRLSIRDLTSSGNQPMTSGLITITFNGEIYNFRQLRQELVREGVVFKTKTDTEVVLEVFRQWGIDGIHKLKGMFAFAVYDAQKNQIVLVRDRVGEKPLFYGWDSGQFIFASELKALFSKAAAPKKVQDTSLAYYLMYGFVPGERCILTNFKKLPPAHYLIYDVEKKAVKISKYWTPPTINQVLNKNKSELTNKLETLLRDAVNAQLDADVPVGVMLSGGVDSSLITAFASEIQPNVKTFNVSFPADSKFNEAKHAQLVADFFKTDHCEIEVDQPNPEILKELALQYDEPIIDSSMLPTYLVTKQISKHCKVALGGDGADELFGGYSHYSQLAKFKQICNVLPLGIRRKLSMVLLPHFSVGSKGRNWVRALASDVNRHVPIIASYFYQTDIHKLIPDKSIKLEIDIEEQANVHNETRTGLVARAMQLDFRTYLPEDILVKIDRASMMNSLEIRAPFLDIDVVEFALACVPEKLKANKGNRKILLKDLSLKKLPNTFDFSRKQGFSIPLDNWLRETLWQDFFKQTLLSTEQTLFSHHYIDSLFRLQSNGARCGEHLFGLLMFELWRKQYQIEVN